MSNIKIVKFDSIEEANLVLNGAIIGGPVLRNTQGLPGLVGLTITFTTPNAAVTFTQPTGYTAGMMRFADIKTQMEAQVTGLKVVLTNNGTIAFKNGTVANPIVMGNNNEPAKTILGFPNSTTITGVVYAGPSGAAPKASNFTVEGLKVFMFLEV